MERRISVFKCGYVDEILEKGIVASKMSSGAEAH